MNFIVKQVGICFLIVLIGLTLFGCRQKPSTTGSPPPQHSHYRNLETTLFDLSTASDPANYASKSNLHYVNGKVRAIIELQTASQSLPSEYNIDIEIRRSHCIQALVPVDSLRKLSNEPLIKFIRPPLHSSPDKNK